MTQHQTLQTDFPNIFGPHPANYPSERTRRTNLSERTRRTNLDVYHPRDDTFSARVHWKSDSSTRSCHMCSKNFWLVRRRHHCRQCGEIFCGTCSMTRLNTFIPGCEAVAQGVRVCQLCALKRMDLDFSWEIELARYFGTEVARRGALLMNHSNWTRQATVSGVQVTVHRFGEEDDDELDLEGQQQGPSAVVGAPSITRPRQSRAAFWVRQPTPSCMHLASANTAATHTGSPKLRSGGGGENAAGAAAGEQRTEVGENILELGECPICQMELSEEAAVDFALPRAKGIPASHSLGTNPNAIVTINQCSHNFHAACLGKWLKDHTTCPMCRANAFKDVKQ